MVDLIRKEIRILFKAIFLLTLCMLYTILLSSDSIIKIQSEIKTNSSPTKTTICEYKTKELVLDNSAKFLCRGTF